MKKKDVFFGKVLFVFLIIVVGLGWWVRREFISKAGVVEVISVDSLDVDELLSDERVFVLDVHVPEQQHIRGTDEFIAFDLLEENVDKLPKDKDIKILVYCRSGNMSREASQKLVEMGHTQVYDLIGGVRAYREVNTAVEIVPFEQDLGVVNYEDGKEFNLMLDNNTDQEVKVTRLSGSCACTQPSMEDLVIPAYSSGVIKVKFVPSIHKDKSDLGQITRTVFVSTDHPNFSKIEASFEANVVIN